MHWALGCVTVCQCVHTYVLVTQDYTDYGNYNSLSATVPWSPSCPPDCPAMRLVRGTGMACHYQEPCLQPGPRMRKHVDEGCSQTPASTHNFIEKQCDYYSRAICYCSKLTNASLILLQTQKDSWEELGLATARRKVSKCLRGQRSQQNQQWRVNSNLAGEPHVMGQRDRGQRTLRDAMGELHLEEGVVHGRHRTRLRSHTKTTAGHTIVPLGTIN